MDHELLQGHWQSNRHGKHKNHIIIQCFKSIVINTSSTNPIYLTNNLCVKINNDESIKLNGSYYSLPDGIMLTFHLYDTDNTIKNYTGKLFYTHPHILHVEEITTLNANSDYYQKDKWDLFDDCEHEDLIFTKIIL